MSPVASPSVLLSVLPLVVPQESPAATGLTEPLDLLVLNQCLLQVSVPAVAELQLEQQPQGLVQRLLSVQQSLLVLVQQLWLAQARQL